jgi:hypothetical protein
MRAPLVQGSAALCCSAECLFASNSQPSSEGGARTGAGDLPDWGGSALATGCANNSAASYRRTFKRPPIRSSPGF